MSRKRIVAFLAFSLALGHCPAHAGSGSGGVSFFLDEQARYHGSAASSTLGLAASRHSRRHRPVRSFATRRHLSLRSFAARRLRNEVPTRIAGSGAIYDLVSLSAARHGVPTALAHRVVRVESGYSCSARNASGAAGIMQVLPGTARSVGVFGNLRDCATGLEAGMRYLAVAYRAAGGSAVGAATLFNRGIGARATPSAYSRRVMAGA